MRCTLSKIITVLFLCALTLSGCAVKEKNEPLRIWSGMDAEHPVIQELCNQFQQKTGTKIELLKVPFKDIRDKFLIAAPAELGPDLLVGPQDWIGVLGVAGLLQPIPEGTLNESDYLPVALQSVKFQKEYYSAPLCMECIALFRNVDLMPNQPKTIKELVDSAVAIQKADQTNQVRGFYFELKDLYFSLPFMTAEGAYLLGEKDGEYNPYDVGMGNAGAIKGANFLRDLRKKYQLVKAGASENLSRTLFFENKAAVILNGPWLLKEAKANHINYAVDPFPVTETGGHPQPVVGVQGLMFNKLAKHPKEARELIKFFSQPENIAKLSLTSGRPPVTKAALALCSDNKDITAFAQIASQGVPMPTHPAVGAIWEPMKQSLELIANDEISADKELPATNKRIIDKIKLMLE